MSSPNPFQAPKAVVADWQDSHVADAVAIREQHIRHEILLKSIGTLYWFGTAICVLVIVALFAALSTTNSNGEDLGVVALFSLIYCVPGIIAAILGYGFRTLKPWVKIPGTIISGIGLLGIPIGTMINGYILYLIWCEKGKRVLADDYATIIAQAPHVKYKRTVGDWIATALIIGLLVAILGLIAFGMVSRQ